MRSDANPGTMPQDETPAVGLYALGLFVLLCAIYLLSYTGILHVFDEQFYAGFARRLAAGQVTLLPYGGPFTLAAGAIYWATQSITVLGPLQAIFLLNIPVTALTAVFLFLLGTTLGFDVRVALFVALLYALATPAWVYSKMLLREPWAAAGLTGALLYAVRFRKVRALRTLALATLCLAMAIATRPSSAVAAPLLFLYVTHAVWEGNGVDARQPLRARALLPALLLLAVLLLVVLGLTFNRYSHYLDRVFEFFNYLKPLAGLLVSPGRGLFIYVPVMVLAILGVPMLARQHPWETLVLYGSAVTYLVIAATHPVWWGGWGWMARFVVPFLPFLIFPIIAVIQMVLIERRHVWLAIPLAVLTLWSLATQLLGVTVGLSTVVVGDANDPAGAFSWAFAPFVWQAAHRGDLTIDIAWMNIAGSWLDRLSIPVLALIIAAAAAAILLRLQRGQLARPRLYLTLTALIIATAGTTLWSINRYYWLDSRYDAQSGLREALQSISNNAQDGDLLVLDYWLEDGLKLSGRLINYCRNDCPPYEEVAREVWNSTPDRASGFQAKMADAARIWLIPTKLQGADPNSVVERWLAEHLFSAGCEWTGPAMRACLYYNTAALDWRSATQPLDVDLGPVRLQEATLTWPSAREAAEPGRITARPGESLLVEIVWKSVTPLAQSYKLSAQLLDAAGQLRAQIDREPVDGFRPTPTWTPGETISDRFVVRLPESVEPGVYQLMVVMYDPQTMTRLAVGDRHSIQLAEIEIAVPQPVLP